VVCDADHSPPSSAEVKNEQELYLLSPHVPPWHAAGSLYLIIQLLVSKKQNFYTQQFFGMPHVPFAIASLCQDSYSVFHPFAIL
jgi:hypothetical protein